MSILCAQYFLNHRLDPKEIAWHVRELAEAGFDGLYAHPRQGLLTPYMSDAWWRAIDAVMRACRRHNLDFWIWDDDYYPSGLAGGRVVWSDPSLACRTLVFTVRDCGGSGPFEIDFDEGLLLRAFALERDRAGGYSSVTDVTEFCGTRRMKWRQRFIKHNAYSPQLMNIAHPHWRTGIDDNRFALCWTPPRQGDYTIVAALERGGRPWHPNLLKPGGIRKFIELIYEPYFERYGREFGRLIKGSFTDEPSPGCHFPWEEAFPAAFRQQHGYDLTPRLAHLAVWIDETTPAVRHHYRLTQHALQEANYVGQLSRWCRRRGIMFTGHLTRMEWLSLVAAWWPNELRMCRRIDIPACDPLGAYAGWKCAAAYHTAAKVASSAAHIFGKRQAGVDALALTGDEAALRDLKYLCDHLVALGINFFNFHGCAYSLDGPRKDEAPPSLFYQNTEWKHMRALSDHVKTVCAALTGGRHLCETAVLYPAVSLACQIDADMTKSMNLPDEKKIHDLVECLLAAHRDFDFIDEATLQEAVAPSGRLRLPERYRAIVLPHLRFIDVRTASALMRFARAGNRVLIVGSVPVALPAGTGRPLRRWHARPAEFCAAMTPRVAASLPGAEVLGKGAEDVFVLRRQKGRNRIMFAFNRSEEPFAGTLDGCRLNIPGRGSVLVRNGKPPPEITAQSETSLSAGWRIAFPQNHIPLSFWHFNPGPYVEREDFTSLRGYDLMQREQFPQAGEDGPAVYYCRFMLVGSVPDARIVMDENGIGGRWKMFVNGHRITRWRKAVVYDCRNIEADAGRFLKSGSTPELNVVAIEASGPGAGLKEVSYLYGSFTAEYRYGHLSFPFLMGKTRTVSLDSLPSWDLLGYPTFSGSASYSNTFSLDRAGEYGLDLGRVESSATVFLDSRRIATLAWPPYRCVLGWLGSGTHSLEVEVANPSANRNHAANLPSGLLGPVRLLELSRGNPGRGLFH